MPEWPLWVWVLIALVVLALIIGIIAAASRGKRSANMERADQLRARAHEQDRLVAAREERAEDLAAKAEAVRHDAISEGERAEVLRRKAEEAEERAALAAEEAELRDDEARHSREALDQVARERDEQLRKADELDPRVRRSHRTDDATDLDAQPDEIRHGDPDAVDTHDPRLDADRDELNRDLDPDSPRAHDDTVDDVPRDEHGRRLDPYGNPVPDADHR
ncbi:hypothetical protein [Tessaracoccus sp. Z1128]